MYGQISQQRPPIHEEIVKTEMAESYRRQTSRSKLLKEEGDMHITPIKVKEEPNLPNMP